MWCASLLGCSAGRLVWVRRAAFVVGRRRRHPLAAELGGGAGGAEDPAAAAAAEQGQGVERRPHLAGLQPEGQLGLIK